MILRIFARTCVRRGTHKYYVNIATKYLAVTRDVRSRRRLGILVDESRERESFV